MKVSAIKAILPGFLCLALAACATGDYASQLSQPNFGVRVLPSFNLDSSAVLNGAYAPKYLRAQQQWAEPLPQ